MNNHANPLISTKWVSNKKALQNDAPVISHNHGVKYNNLGLNNACILMISIEINATKIGK
jgi:hypothetical protein